MMKKITDEICNLLLALLLCFSIIYTLMDSLGLKMPVYVIVFYVAVLLTVYRLAFLSRLSLIISGIALLAGLAYAAIQVFTKIGTTRILEFLYSYFTWLYDLVVYGTFIEPLFSNITFLALCIITSVYFFFFTGKRYVFLMSIMPGVITFSVQSILNYIVTLVPFYIFIFTLVLCYFKHIHGKNLESQGNEYLGSSTFLFWIIPVAVITVLTASIIKASDKPLEWKWLDTKVNAVYNYFYDKFDYAEFDYFSVASSGFGDKNNLLGGRVRPNNTLVLTVETDNNNVYLKGTTYDQYTGKSWVNTGESKPFSAVTDEDNLLIDVTEIFFSRNVFSLHGFFEENLTDEKVKVVYQNIRTKSVFLPAATLDFTPLGKESGFLLDIETGVTTSEKRLGTGFSYEFEYLKPKRTEEFAQLLRGSKQGLYNDITRDERIKRYIYPFINKSINIYEKYLSVPDTVPQRVFDLASSLTVQYDNNYDKVKALEEYLSGNFPYNLDVRALPRNRDFVDYFLFDQKEGYCTYYASALTIMARCIGIPARYVEGYILPPKPAEDNPRLYYVSNNQAHAWTEVYFEGYGWLPFEATAPFRSSFYSSPVEAPVFSGEMATDPAYLDYMEMMKEYNEGMTSLPIDFGDLEIEEPPYLIYVSVALGILILAILSILLFNTIKTKMKIYKIMHLEPRESVLKLYRYFVTVLSYSGYKIQSGETPLQYSERVDKYLYFRPVKFKDITDIFIRSRYSTQSISDKEKQILMEFIPRLTSEARNDMGKMKYFFFRRALGRF